MFALSVRHINNPVNDFELLTSILKSIQLRADLDIFASRVKSSSPGLPTFETETRKLTIPIQPFLCGRRPSADQSKNSAGNQSVKRLGRLINFTANPSPNGC